MIAGGASLARGVIIARVATNGSQQRTHKRCTPRNHSPQNQKTACFFLSGVSPGVEQVSPGWHCPRPVDHAYRSVDALTRLLMQQAVSCRALRAVFFQQRSMVSMLVVQWPPVGGPQRKGASSNCPGSHFVVACLGGDAVGCTIWRSTSCMNTCTRWRMAPKVVIRVELLPLGRRRAEQRAAAAKEIGTQWKRTSAVDQEIFLPQRPQLDIDRGPTS